MNIIYSREEVIFLVFSHLNVYYTPHFHFSVVNYSLGCKEVYIIVIFFFSPEADGPKKCIVRLYLDSFGHHSLLEENAWDVVAFSFSQTKDFWLFLRRDLQVEFGANHKTEEEVKSFLLLPYSPLRRKESILCPKLGQKKGGGGEDLNPTVVPPMLIAVAFRHTLICLLPVPYLLTDSSKGRAASRAETEGALPQNCL